MIQVFDWSLVCLVILVLMIYDAFITDNMLLTMTIIVALTICFGAISGGNDLIQLILLACLFLLIQLKIPILADDNQDLNPMCLFLLKGVEMMMTA